MSIRIISEAEFRERLIEVLDAIPAKQRARFDYVTGPGRSGAVAAVYASHYLGLPFVPYKCSIPGKNVLIVDTALLTGKTLRKASRLYGDAPYIFAYDERPEHGGIRVKFWYEELSLTRGKGHEFPGSAKSKSLTNH